MTASAIYEGSVRHRRAGPIRHEFRAPLFMMYLDLGELPQLFDGRLLWSARRPAAAWFRRSDYLGDPAVALDTAVRDLVCERIGVRPNGPVRVLTHLRYFGYCINPVSFYYCFDAAGEHVIAVVAEVTNTPWGQRHAYVMDVRAPANGGTVTLMRQRFAKELHVSPFMGMDHSYEWRLTEPAEQLLVHIESEREGEVAFDATLSLRRREISGASLARTLSRHPLMTARVAGGIYAHAARLKLKGARYFPNPAHQQGPHAATTACGGHDNAKEAHAA